MSEDKNLTELPKFHETFIPILNVLENGEIIHYNDLLKKVKEKYYQNLPQELLTQKTKTGTNVLLDRIGWGKSYLKQAKMLDYPKRAMVQITQKGKDALQRGILTIQDLKKDVDWLKFQDLKKTEEISQKKNLETKNLFLEENATPQELIDQGFKTIETQVKNDLLEKLKQIDPYYFEKVILILLKKMGYGEFVETSKSGDGGIDGIINEDKLGLEKIYIQAKRYNQNKVRETDIRNFIGAMSGDTTKDIFVTTSSFDDLAIKKALEAHHKIILIDGLKLVDLMYQYGVGVQIYSIYEMKELDEDFFERS